MFGKLNQFLSWSSQHDVHICLPYTLHYSVMGQKNYEYRPRKGETHPVSKVMELMQTFVIRTPTIFIYDQGYINLHLHVKLGL